MEPDQTLLKLQWHPPLPVIQEPMSFSMRGSIQGMLVSAAGWAHFSTADGHSSIPDVATLLPAEEGHNQFTPIEIKKVQTSLYLVQELLVDG